MLPLHNGWRGAALAGLGLGALVVPDVVAVVLVVLGISLLRSHVQAVGGLTTKERRK